MNKVVNSSLNRNHKVIIYLIQKLGNLVECRKKLMKLIFLVEHYDPNKEKLTKKPFLGNDFIIYHYGVFSFEVMDDYIDLNYLGIISEYPIKVNNIEVDLDINVKNRVDKIIEKFGKKTASELEVETLGMLGLSKDKKKVFFGESIQKMIKN